MHVQMVSVNSQISVPVVLTPFGGHPDFLFNFDGPKKQLKLYLATRAPVSQGYLGSFMDNLRTCKRQDRDRLGPGIC